MQKLLVPPPFICVIFIILFSSNGYTSVADEHVNYGIDALQNKDYKKALQWLTSPKANASEHPDKQNALGLSYYYLEQYSKAMKHFKLAQKTPRRYEAAFYLGDIAQKQDRIKRAKYWYSIAAKQYDDIEVQAHAENALLALSLGDNQATIKRELSRELRQYLYVSLDTNYIDGIIDPDDSSGTDENDTSTSFLLAGKVTLTPVKSLVDLRLGAHYYAEKYANITAYNTDLVSVFTTLGTVVDEQYLETRLKYSKQTLDGEDYLNHTEISFKDTIHNVKNSQFIFTGRFIETSSPTDNYSQYNGDTTEAGVEIRKGEKIKVRLGLRWRNEARQGLSPEFINDSGDTFTGFTAYAREMLIFRTYLSWLWSNKWQQNIEVKYRDTEYKDDDLFLASSSDTQLSSQTRSSNRVTAKVELIHHVTKKLDLTLRYKMIDEDVNDDIYDYTSQTISAGISYIF